MKSKLMLERVVFKRQGRICLSLSCVENDMLKGRSPARYTNYFFCFCYYDLGLGGFVVLVMEVIIKRRECLTEGARGI